jgi:hypothetical protein
VIAILEAISNSVSALPSAVACAPPASVQGGPGGFAATLAAAQGLSSASTAQTASDDEEASDGSAAAGAAATLNGRMPASGNFQLKKLPNSGPPVAVSMVAAAPVVAQELIPTLASQIPTQASLEQSSLPQLGFPQPGLLQSNLSQASLLPALTAVAQVKTSDQAAEEVQTGLQTGYSAASQPSGTFGLSASFDPTGNLTNPSTPRVLIPNVSHQAGQQETAMANSTQLPVLSTATGGSASGAVFPSIIADSQQNSSPQVESTQARALSATTGPAAPDTLLRNTSPGSQLSGFENQLGPAESTLLAEGTPPAALSATTGQPATSTLSVGAMQNVTPENQGGASLDSGAGLQSEESRLQTNQAGESTVPAAILVASAIPQAGSTAAVLPSSAAPASAAQTDLSDPGTGNPLSGIINGLSVASPILNPAVQLASGRTALRFAAPRVTATVASPSSRAPVSVSSIGSDSANGSPMASQTPFSVFFSGPGPGTESAASTLPKMILPVAGAAIRGGQTSASGQPTASSETGGPQSAVSTSAGAQNTNTKDQAAGTESGSLQAAQPLHRDAELTAASAQFASAQNGAAQVATPPASPGSTLPLAQPTPPTAALPKPDTLLGNAPGAPPSLVPPPETPAVAAPGPVQMAQLVNRVEQSEMRIGMNTSAFGSVEVRAVVHASDVGLVIGSEKGDLRSLLANEIPAITNTLQQQSLRLNSVNFMQGFAFSNNGSGGGDSQQRPFTPMSVPANSLSFEATVNDSAEPPAVGEFGGGGSLSILA